MSYLSRVTIVGQNNDLRFTKVRTMYNNVPINMPIDILKCFIAKSEIFSRVSSI